MTAPSQHRSPKRYCQRRQFTLPAPLGVLIAVAVWTCIPLARQLGAQPSDSLHALVRASLRASETDSTAERWERQWNPDRAPSAHWATAALLRATLYRATFDVDVADSLYQRIILDSARHPIVAAHALSGQGALLAQSFRFVPARLAYERAIEQFRRLNDLSGLAEAYGGLAAVRLRTVGIPGAREAMAQARQLAPKHDSWLQSRLACADALLIVRAAEQLTDAQWQELQQHANQAGARVASDCLLARAQQFEAQGASERALHILDTLTALQQRHRLWNAQSAALQWQGYLLLMKGRYAEARTALAEAIVLGEQSHTLTSSGWANLNLATLSARIGAWGDADRYLARSRQAMEQAQDQTGLLFARSAQASGALLRGRVTQARREFEGLAIGAERLSPHVLVYALVPQIDIARRERRFDDARALADSAARLARKHDMAAVQQHELLYQRASLAFAEGHVDEARTRWTSLLATSVALQAPAQFEVLSRLAELESSIGRFDESMQWMRRGMESLDAWSATLTHPDLVLTALQDRHLDWNRDLGLASVVAALANAGRGTDALAIAEWRRARQLQRDELQRRALVATATGSSPSAPWRTQAASAVRLPHNIAVISFITGSGGQPTTVFVHTTNTLQTIVLGHADALVEPIERFTALLVAGQWPRGLANALHKSVLHDALATLPRTVERLLIVPDGPLHRLPFAALQLPNGDALGHRFELAIAPSVQVAINGLHPTRALTATRSGVLAIGAPDRWPDADLAGGPWVTLPGAHAEVRRVADRWRGGELLAGINATRSAFLRSVKTGGPVLHIATHAFADEGSIAGSALLLRPTPTDAGLLEAAQLSSVSVPFDVVLLSACETTVGLSVLGEGPQGLASAMLQAGARAVVATRWRLDDQTVTSMLERFYDALHDGHDVTAALTIARRDAIERGASPALWANLDVFGDPAVLVQLQPRDTRLAGIGPWVLLSVLLSGWLYRSRSRRRTALRS